jgi:hypothetical protein
MRGRDIAEQSGDTPLLNMSNFDKEWGEYRKRRNLLLFAFLGYVPIVSAFAFLSFKFFHTDVPAFVFAFGWMAFFLVAGIHLNCWPCPRCGKWFAAKWWYRNPFARRCVHCGLRKYSSN